MLVQFKVDDINEYYVQKNHDKQNTDHINCNSYLIRTYNK